MSELLDILDAMDRMELAGTQVALATVVRTRGSTYRHAGARLLVPAVGEPVGTISGGCLEDDVTRLARHVIESGEPRLVRFDLTAEDDALWGLGLGCNGVIDVYIEPPASARTTATFLREARADDAAAALVTVVVSSDPGVRAGLQLTVRADQSAGSRSVGAERALVELGLRALSRRSSPGLRSIRTEGGRLRVFIDVQLAPLRLVVCGAGDDAIPLVAVAARLGWKVSVADARNRLLTRERFPAAETFIAGDPRRTAGRVEPDRRTFVVVMTHNFLRDAEYLASFLPSPAAYIGLLGPRRRAERLLDELGREGLQVRARDRARLHAPAGLDLGGEEPIEIAVAIASEILAVHSGRHGGPLRDRHAAIHGSRRSP
jgi:xanthine dehydrogenase accessory factor